MTEAPTLDEILAVMTAASVGDAAARVALPEEPQLDDPRIRFAIAVNLLLDRLAIRGLAHDSQIQHDRFCTLIEKSADVVSLTSADGTTLYMSPAIKGILGYQPDDLVGKASFSFVHPDDRGRVFDTMTRLLLDPSEHVSVDFRGVHRDGSHRWLEATGTNLLRDPSVGAIVGNLRNVTGRREAEIALRLSEEHNRVLEAEAVKSALRRSEEHFRLLVESVQDCAILMLDIHGKVTSWNIGAERIKGYRADEIIGRHFSCFYSPEDVQAGEPERTLQAALANGHSEAEGWRLRKDGSRFWANVVITALTDENGTPCGFAKVTRDFTLRKKAEDDIRSLNRDLVRTSRAKSDFLAMMSHELRTPLNSILGFTEVLLDGKFGDFNERQERFLRNVQASGHHLLGLINDLLDLSKVEAGRFAVALSPCPVQVIVSEVLATLQPVADAGRVKLAALPIDREASVSADPVRLKQVLYNLLSNAIKFTPEGGQVTVRAWSLESQIRVSVTDTGAGISAEELLLLFTPFTQLANAKGKVGTGLGLALTKKLVELMGGRIDVESTPGSGTTFCVDLPSIASVRLG